MTEYSRIYVYAVVNESTLGGGGSATNQRWTMQLTENIHDPATTKNIALTGQSFAQSTVQAVYRPGFATGDDTANTEANVTTAAVTDTSGIPDTPGERATTPTVPPGVYALVDFEAEIGGANSWADTINVHNGASGSQTIWITDKTKTTSHELTTSAGQSVAKSFLEGAYFSVFGAPTSAGGDEAYYVYLGNVSICFHGDTLIETDKGRIAARDLKRGDMVKTYQEGFQPISRAIKVNTGGSKKFVVMEKDALKPGVPSETYMSTTGHPLKYGDRYVCAGQLATSQYTKNDLIRIEQVKCDAYYSLQFDKHYTFNANGVESQSLPTTTSWCGMALPETLFHDQTLYDKSKIGKGNDSAFLHTEAELVLPLTKEDVEVFRKA